jgi:signal peptidase I
LLRWLWDWTKSVAAALVVYFLVSTFVFENFRIISGSMERTMLLGDVLWVNKALYGAKVPLIPTRLPGFREPRRGEIIVFESVETPGLSVTKRVIGLPGDTLAMEGGVLRRNRQAADEPYVRRVNPAAQADSAQEAAMRGWQVAHYVGAFADRYHPTLQDWGPVVVPGGALFVMGDNRDESYDARYWGFLPRNNVRGRAMLIWYSYDPSSYRAWPLLTATRWERIFTWLR